jgi:hypothetical protein
LDSARANAGRTVVGYYTRDFSPVPTATDHTCQRGFLSDQDTVVGNN